MRRVIILLLFGLSQFLVKAQVPQFINYQGVTRDNNGSPVTGTFTLTLDIVNAGPVYSEKHVINTGSLGLFNVKIGQGQQLSAQPFTAINWANGPYSLKVVAFDGTNTVNLGTQALASVPFALYAANGGGASPTLAINGNSLSISGGNTVVLNPGAGSTTLNGIDAATVTTIGPNNFNIIVPQVSITGMGSSTVSGSFPSFTISSTAGSLGGITSINTASPLTGGPILTSGTISLLPSGVASGSYGSAPNTIPTFSVDNYGRLVNAGTYTIPLGPGTMSGNVVGPIGNNTVVAIQNNPVSATTPTIGQVLAYVAGAWTPSTLPTPATPSIVGAGIATVNPLTGNSFTVNVATPNFTGAGSTTVTGTYPNFSINTPTASVGWSILGNAGTNSVTNFIGTTDAAELSFRINNQRAGRIENTSQSLYLGFLSGPSINTASANTGIGYFALNGNTSGYGNTGIGNLALRLNSTGIWNTAIGGAAQWGNTTGSSNVALGYQALRNNSVGSGNVAIGRDAMLQNTDATGENVVIGAFALNSSTVGSYNVMIGTRAGFQNVNGSNNVFIGNQAGFNETGSNKLYISNSQTNPPLIYGDFSQSRIGLGTINPAFPLHIVTNIYPGIQIDGSDPNWSGYYVNATNAGASPFYGYKVGNMVKAYHYSNGGGDWFLNNNGATNFVVLANGNAGVGTINPSINSRLAIANGHLQTKQSTAPTIAFASGYAGSISLTPGSTDVAGKFTMSLTNAPCAGCAIMTITFNTVYAVPPVVVITPASLYGSIEFSGKSFYVNPSTNGFSIHSNGFPVLGQSLSFTYMVIEAN